MRFKPFIILALLMASSNVLAQPDEPVGEAIEEATASDANEADAAGGDSSDAKRPGSETAPTAATGAETADPDDELDEDIYDDDSEDPNIEVITVRGSDSDGAADFEVGDSVAAFDAADLEALGAQSIADLASFTPNLEIVTAGATTPTIFIRGVGLNDFNANSSGAVAVYLNGVPKNSPALQLGTLFDVENVNILRGPQGSGNYRSANAGAIKIYSRKPTGEYNATFRQSYGNYDSIDLEGAVGGPVYEDYVSGRFAFRFSDRAGYGINGCGDAPPRSERATRPLIGLSQGTSPPWSLCGDDVPFAGAAILGGGNNRFYDGKSLIEEGLPTHINNQHNWAARGTLFFQPTLDQEWLLTLSGANRNELTRQGQSHGTNRESGSTIGSFGTFDRGVLGSEDGSSYIPLEVQRQRWKIDPCRDNQTGDSVDSDGNPVCALPSGAPDLNKIRFSNFVARAVLAEDLATNLDSDPYRGDYNAPGKTQLETWGVTLQGDLVVAEEFSIKTVTGFDRYDRHVGSDLDQSPNRNFEIVTDDDGWQFAQLIDIEGEVSEEIPLSWKVGALYLYEELNVAVRNSFGGIAALIGVSNRAYKQKLWSGGAFAEFTFKFWEKFAVDAGVRYNWERKSMDYVLVRAGTIDFPLFARETWQAPTGTVRLTYNFKETAYAFWKYTRGWKGGHYNATGGSDGVFAAKPENIDAFEFGLHGSWWTGVLTLDFSLFHYNYKNYQLFTAQQRFDGLPEFVVINAANSEVYGSELDIILRPLPRLMLRARLAWLQSQFLDYTQIQVERREFGFGNAIVLNNEIQNSGAPLLNSPNFKISLTAEQTIPLGRLGTLAARWDGAWTDDTNYDATQSKGVPNFEGNQFLPDGTIGQKAFWQHNVRLGYRTPDTKVEIAGWVRNVTDKVYKTFAFDVSSFNGTTIFFLGEPRMYGVTLTTSF